MPSWDFPCSGVCLLPCHLHPGEDFLCRPDNLSAGSRWQEQDVFQPSLLTANPAPPCVLHVDPQSSWCPSDGQCLREIIASNKLSCPNKY